MTPKSAFSSAWLCGGADSLVSPAQRQGFTFVRKAKLRQDGAGTGGYLGNAGSMRRLDEEPILRAD